MTRMLGIGTDLVDSRRVACILDRYSHRFLQRVFTDIEQEYCKKQAFPALAFSKRLAAKEACAKALGWGIGEKLSWRDMGIETHRSGAPVMVFSPQLRCRICAVFGACDAWVSLSDEAPYALAFVVLTLTPEAPSMMSSPVIESS